MSARGYTKKTSCRAAAQRGRDAVTLTPRAELPRRAFLLRSGLALSGVAADAIGLVPRARAAPALLVSDPERPQLAQGIQLGDVCADRAIVWSRCDRPGRMSVEWDVSERFTAPHRVSGPHALEDSDYTARVDLSELPADRDIHVRVRFQSLNNARAWSEPVLGSFRSAPQRRSGVRFLWSGDTAGQGYGINPDIGGMRIYETMRTRKPDFFIHSGDTIYADAPILPQITVEGGAIWRNLTTPEKSKVAETLAEFRGAYRYNLLDENVRRFNAQVPQIWQWDDHEVVDNYSPAKNLAQKPAYAVKDVPLLIARGHRAFLEYAPLRHNGDQELERIYRSIRYGKSLEVFVLDMRSYRGPNGYNRQERESDESAFLGRAQLDALAKGLAASRATWKVIAADMPIGLVVRDGLDAQGRAGFEAIANGDGPALGRELEIANLLRFIKRHKVRNVVWITADVHYTAAHFYDPKRAQFRDFDPFWEFVSGPLNAGNFGPNEPDDTFGMNVVFQKVAPVINCSPLGGCQFFGEVDIDERRATLTVTLRDTNDNALYVKTLEARR